MEAQNQDWIGIYPADSTNDWENVIAWRWTEDFLEGNLNFNALPEGNYDIRAFYNNSFVKEANKKITVSNNVIATTVKTNKNIYTPAENIVTNFTGVLGNDDNWIAIYPAGSTNAWENMIQWSWIDNGVVNGEHIFNALPAGKYEARVFFNNSFNLESSQNFSVEDNNPPIARILYDDFEDGIDPRWRHTVGRVMTLQNVGVQDGGVESTGRKNFINGQHSLRTYIDGGYYFPFNQPDVRLKFFEIDVNIGVASHRFNFGVRVRTALGDRSIEFSSWLNHTLPSGAQIIRGPYGNILPGHTQAYIKDGIHLHPGPSDFYVGTTGIGGGQRMFVHYKIDIEEKLKLLEPNNELLEIVAFTCNGGDYDNLALSSQ